MEETQLVNVSLVMQAWRKCTCSIDMPKETLQPGDSVPVVASEGRWISSRDFQHCFKRCRMQF